MSNVICVLVKIVQSSIMFVKRRMGVLPISMTGIFKLVVLFVVVMLFVNDVWISWTPLVLKRDCHLIQLILMNAVVPLVMMAIVNVTFSLTLKPLMRQLVLSIMITGLISTINMTARGPPATVT